MKTQKIFSLMILLVFTLNVNAWNDISFKIKNIIQDGQQIPIDGLSGWLAKRRGGEAELAIFEKGNTIIRHQINLDTGVFEKEVNVARFKSIWVEKVVEKGENPWDTDKIRKYDRIGKILISAQVFEEKEGVFILGIEEGDEILVLTGTYYMSDL